MRRSLTLTLLAALALCLGAAPAQGAFGIDHFDVSFTGPPPPGVTFEDADQRGEVVTQAGAHPFAMTTSLSFIAEPTGKGGEVTEQAVKDILVDQIAGFVGNPTAVPRCATADFLTDFGGGVPACQDGSAVGVVSTTLSAEELAAPLYGAVYNLAPPPGVAAKLGFWISKVPVTIELGVRPTYPYNITGGPTNISQLLEVIGTELTLWGTPADPAHDPLRGHCLAVGTGESSGSCPANVSAVPFLTLPRACQGPLPTLYRADSWQSPGAFVEGADLSEPITGCGKLAFGPEVAIAPTTTSAESASGLELEITATDEGLANPSGLAAADIAATAFAFPAGVTLNPSAAEGLGVCTLAQYAAASLTDPGCPPASKLGTLQAETPVLEDHVFEGSVYLAAQGANPFGSLFAAYLIVRDAELGILTKVAVRIDTNPQSGQVIATATEIPPFPFSRISLRLRSGPRAPLITPPACGAYASAAALTPSSGSPAQASFPAFAITSGPGGAPCPAAAPFAPGFEAGTLNNAAGRYAPFFMRLTRRDAEQDITRFAATLARGLSGKIAGIAPCPDAAIAAARARSGRSELAAPSCPAASRLGRVLAGAGVGSALTYVGGSLHLAGPYNGAPLSVAAIVPAVAGPFDVGTVVTRVALRLNPSTAQVEVDGAASDPIPHILQGIPLKVRDLRILTDRPEFTLNATSCAPGQTNATIFGSGANPFSGADDSAVSLTERYQAASCASLGFKPRLKLRLTGPTRRAKNPGFRAELISRGEDANLKGAIVNLPPSQFIDNSHISNPCTRVQFNEGACPKASILGRARAFTPLLDDPLEGNVYFRSNGGERKLPDLVVALKGQFDFNLVIAVLEARGHVKTKVLNAPDAPVSRFVLRMFKGKRSLLENSENLCAKKQRARLNLIGQNGRRAKSRPVIKTSCGAKKKKKSKRHLRR